MSAAHTPGPFAQHPTPGPWVASGLSIGGPHLIAMADKIDPHGFEGEANARLIAAAPDLLDVARKALAAWTGEGPAIVLDELRAAIAKATGAA